MKATLFSLVLNVTRKGRQPDIVLGWGYRCVFVGLGSELLKGKGLVVEADLRGGQRGQNWRHKKKAEFSVRQRVEIQRTTNGSSVK